MLLSLAGITDSLSHWQIYIAIYHLGFLEDGVSHEGKSLRSYSTLCARWRCGRPVSSVMPDMMAVCPVWVISYTTRKVCWSHGGYICPICGEIKKSTMQCRTCACLLSGWIWWNTVSNTVRNTFLKDSEFSGIHWIQSFVITQSFTFCTQSCVLVSN